MNNRHTGPEGSSPVSFPALRFDPEAYRAYVEDQGLTDDEAIELLHAVWAVVVGFVDLGFPLVGSSEQDDCGESPSVLTLADQFTINANDMAVVDAEAPPAAKEDS